MKKMAIMVLLMGLSLNNVAASVQAIGHYETTTAGFALTTNDGSVTNLEIETFLGVTGLEGVEGSAVKGSLNILKGEIFSFDWIFTPAWTSSSSMDYDDFSFVNLKLGTMEVFKILAKASDTNKSDLFEWTATESGLLNFGIGIMDLGDNTEDSSLTISKLNSVPLPAAAWFFLTGLLGLAGFKQKRSAI